MPTDMIKTGKRGADEEEEKAEELLLSLGLPQLVGDWRKRQALRAVLVWNGGQKDAQR